MTVRSCEVEGKPGYQNRTPGRAPGPCYTYDPADVQSRDFALRRAANDFFQATQQETQDPAIG